MIVITNNKPRNFISWHDLTKKEKGQFDYMTNPEESEFFRYRGTVYELGEFMHTSADFQELGWHGIATHSYFSGVIVKLLPDCDELIVGRYYS